MAKRTSITQPSNTSSRSTPPVAHPISATKKAFSDPIAVAVMVGTIVAATAAVGGLAYSIGKDVGQAELKTRQDLAAINLPMITADTRSSTNDLKIASAAFKDMLVNNATYQDMKSRYERQIAVIKDLENQITILNSSALESQTQIKSLEEQLFPYENPERVYSLKKGSSEQTSDGEIIVGMQYFLSGFAEIMVNGKRESAQSGQVFELRGLKGGLCVLKILSVSISDTATFSANCTPAKN